MKLSLNFETYLIQTFNRMKKKVFQLKSDFEISGLAICENKLGMPKFCRKP